MALSRDQEDALTRRVQVLLGRIAERAVGPVSAAWASLPAYDRAQAEAFAEATLPATTAAKAASVAVATGYYAQLLDVPAPAISAAAVPVTFDHLAPFRVTWKALADGHLFDEAARMGMSTAQAEVRNLTISSARSSGDIVAERSGVRVVGWRRDAEAGACPWCQDRDGIVFDTASDGDFGHDRCNCTVRPLTAA